MHSYLGLAAVAALAVIGRFVFLLFADAMRECAWCAPRKRLDGSSQPPWWARWCWRCRGRREHFRLGAPTARRVRVALREAWRELQARRIARRIGGDL